MTTGLRVVVTSHDDEKFGTIVLPFLLAPETSNLGDNMRHSILLASSLVLLSTAAMAQDSYGGRYDRGYNGRNDSSSYQNDRGPSYLRDERRDSRYRDNADQSFDKQANSDRQAKADVKSDDTNDETVEPAHFFFRDGDRRVRIQCDTRETMKACVEAASMVFEKFKTNPSQSPAPSSSDTKQQKSSAPQ